MVIPPTENPFEQTTDPRIDHAHHIIVAVDVPSCDCVMDEVNPFENLFSPQGWDVHGCSPENHSAGTGRAQATPLPNLSASNVTTPNDSATATPRQCQHNRLSRLHSTRLPLLQFDEWDKDKDYNDSPLTCVHYHIEWKVTLSSQGQNKKVISRDTETDLVLAPGPYWQHYLRARLEELLQNKLGSCTMVKSDDTNVVVSVTSRAERDFVKRFNGLSIDWSPVEKQLVEWSSLYRNGKKLRLDITFNYVGNGKALVGSVGQLQSRKVGSSATQRMRSELAAQVDAEEVSTGQPAVWRDVYRVMRCLGPSCQLGPHCWSDPDSKKHYRLNSHHLRSLVKFVQDGSRLESHDDVPTDFRDQLYAEEQQKQERKAKTATASSMGLTPITINNNFPETPVPAKLPVSEEVSGLAKRDCSAENVVSHLNIPGPRDVAVRKYAEWQQMQVQDVLWKNEVRKACNTVLAECLDLEQLYQDHDAEFLIQKGIKRGIARRFVSDIDTWVKRLKRQ